MENRIRHNVCRCQSAAWKIFMKFFQEGGKRRGKGAKEQRGIGAKGRKKGGK
jgi:hypothetical protein